MKTWISILVVGLAATPAWADGGHRHMPGLNAGEPVQAPTQWAEGEVRRVDRAQGRVTLRHGPIESLNMPPMTMVFRVQDPAWLENIKPGDNIRFQAERIDGTYTILRLERGR